MRILTNWRDRLTFLLRRERKGLHFSTPAPAEYEREFHDRVHVRMLVVDPELDRPAPYDREAEAVE